MKYLISILNISNLYQSLIMSELYSEGTRNFYIVKVHPSQNSVIYEELIEKAVNGEKGFIYYEPICDDMRSIKMERNNPRLYYRKQVFPSEDLSNEYYMKCFEEDVRNFQYLPHSLKSQEMANKYYDELGLNYQTCDILGSFITARMILNTLEIRNFDYTETKRFLIDMLNANPNLFIDSLRKNV